MLASVFLLRILGSLVTMVTTSLSVEVVFVFALKVDLVSN